MEKILFFIVVAFLLKIAYNSFKEARKNAQQDQQAAEYVIAQRNDFNKKLNNLPISDIVVKKNAEKIELDLGGYDIKTIRLRKNAKLSNIQDFVAIDVETTGLSPQNSEIISIAAVRFVSLEPIEAIYTYVKPSSPIPSKITEITGISDDDVEDSPSFAQVRESITKFIGNYNIVAHNIIFDLRFLRHQGVDLDGSKRKYFDTLELSRLYDEDADNHKLTTACLYNGIMLDDNAHDACADALACGLLFAKYVNDKVQPFEQ